MTKNADNKGPLTKEIIKERLMSGEVDHFEIAEKYKLNPDKVFKSWSKEFNDENASIRQRARQDLAGFHNISLKATERTESNVNVFHRIETKENQKALQDATERLKNDN